MGCESDDCFIDMYRDLDLLYRISVHLTRGLKWINEY